MLTKLTILGTSAALPAYGRNLSAHLLEIDEHSILFDCGEGTQFQLRKYNKNFNKISHIFISHLHGDHFFGLPGLLSSMQMTDRKLSLSIYGPQGLEKAIKTMLFNSRSEYSFRINFIEVKTTGKTTILKNKKFNVFAFPLKHSIETYGYFIEKHKPLLNIKKDFVEKKNVSFEEIKSIKKGADFIDEKGIIYKNKDITKPPKDIISYAYCSDTAYSEELVNWINGVYLLYHESTYLEEDIEKAKSRLHSTAKQAARIANIANAKKLLLGHFSGRYSNISLFLKEANELFDDVIIGEEGKEIVLEV